MPPIVTGQRNSYQDISKVRFNVDERLDFLTPMDTPFLSYIGFMADAGGATSGANTLKFPCFQPQHTWLNDELVPKVSSFADPYTTSDGEIIVPTGESQRFDVDDIVMAGETYWEVTGTDHGDDKLVVTVISGDANFPAGETLYLIGNARAEGTAASVITARTTSFGETRNFTQIFMAKIDLNGTEQATERYALNQDPFEFQLDKRLKELALQMEVAAIYGIRNDTYPANNSTKRRMGGYAFFVRDDAKAQANGLVHDANGEDLDEIMLNEVLAAAWEQGAEPDTAFVGMRQKTMISSFLVPQVRVSRDESIYGSIVGTFLSDAGEVNVVLNRHLKRDDLIATTRSMIGMGPLEGNGNSRKLFVEGLPKDGDYDRAQVIGEYTMEVRNNTKAHGWIKNLSKK